MGRPYASDPRQIYKSTPSGVMDAILIGFGTAMLLGLVSGVVWVIFNLLRG
jgi:hypothetical protein